jgi:hypothetical protein
MKRAGVFFCASIPIFFLINLIDGGGRERKIAGGIGVGTGSRETGNDICLLFSACKRADKEVLLLETESAASGKFGRKIELAHK